MNITRFRMFLIASALLPVATIAAAFLPSGYAQALSDAYASEPVPWLFQNESAAIGIGAAALAITIAGYVGLFLLKRWGRTLSLGITLLGLPLYLLSGPTLMSPFEAMLSDTSWMVWGACLALAYYSPVAARMEGGSDSQSSSG